MIEFLEFLGRLTILVLVCVTAFRVLRAMFLGDPVSYGEAEPTSPRSDGGSSLFGGPLSEPVTNPTYRTSLGNLHHDDWDE